MLRHGHVLSFISITFSPVSLQLDDGATPNNVASQKESP